MTRKHPKALDEEALKVITTILNDINNTGIILKDIKQSVLTFLKKQKL